MDTAWYAVDEAGYVAVVLTGESGTVPDEAGSHRLLDDLSARTFGTDPTAYVDRYQAAPQLGVFLYEHHELIPLVDVEDRYRRELIPDRPLHVDQLPPDLRKDWKRLRPPGVRFAETEFLQPYEFFACTSYDVGAFAYLAADGKTIRPIPGREDAFRAAVARWREDEPDLLADYRFEG
jgi:hypothetical protein